MVSGLALGLWLSGYASLAADPGATDQSPSPYHRLRDTQLQYLGPDEDVGSVTEFRIGWFGPSDSTNQLGADMWCAANLALSDLDSATVAGPPPLEAPGSESQANQPATRNLQPATHNPPPFRLLPRWSADPWGSGVSQLTRMVYEEKPLALLGSIDSATTHLAEQVVAKANLPLVSPIATDDSITLAGVSWMFSCAPSDRAVARVLVEDVLSALGENGRLALLTATDHESRMTSREVVRELTRRQRPPNYRFELPSETNAAAPSLDALLVSRPTAVLIIAPAAMSAHLTCMLRASPLEKDLRPLLFGAQPMARTLFRELAGAAAEGVRFPLLCPTVPDTKLGREFVSRFAAERGHEPDYTAFLTYDATRMLGLALREAGPNRSRIRSTLVEMSPWQGIAGVVSFDGTGQNTRTNVQMATLRQGRIVPCDAGCAAQPPATAERSPGTDSLTAITHP